MSARSFASVRRSAGQEAEGDFHLGVDKLIERKQQLFPHIKRFVVDFTVTDEGKHFRLAVVSTLTSEDIVSRPQHH
ncbi:MAG: hypothetical protein NZM11_09265 [Anaerolineales bacterium]|nr:hypothetical protein [Anaerolineales bacterium]